MLSKTKIVFKDYTPKQMMLLPPSLEELIDVNHPVRIVDRIIDKIDIESLTKTYKGGGTSSYHPRMLLKVLVYAYLLNIYSSRGIEDQLKENLHFMWISGMNRPDHNTIYRFRSKRLKDEIKKIFALVVSLLAEEGIIRIEEAFLDGTKIEVNANRYTFVWGRAIRTNKEKIREQLEGLWSYVEQIYKSEQEELEKPEFQEITPEKVEALIEQINTALKEKKIDKKVRQKLTYAAKNWPAKLEVCQEKEAILDKHNSYSKTDSDATFMRMKEDHMLNGQLKPGYNFMISTNKQFITCYIIEQATTDTTCLIPHLEEYNRIHNRYPKEITADAGFGSEENYAYMEGKIDEAYVKYNYFHKEQTHKSKNDPFSQDNLHYNKELDCFYCPMGQPMRKIGEQKRKTRTGYIQENTLYQAVNCNGCPLRSMCHKSDTQRIIAYNHTLKRYKQKEGDLLCSEKGIQCRGQRAWDVEGTFTMIKHNKKFKKFHLRGKEKVEIEAGLPAIAHNISKISA